MFNYAINTQKNNPLEQIFFNISPTQLISLLRTNQYLQVLYYDKSKMHPNEQTPNKMQDGFYPVVHVLS